MVAREDLQSSDTDDEIANFLAGQQALAAGQPTPNQNYPHQTSPWTSDIAMGNNRAPKVTQTNGKINPEEEARAAQEMQANKQMMLRKVAKKKLALEKELFELENSLKDLRNIAALKALSFFSISKRITILIDILLDQMKKRAKKLSIEGRIKLYQGIAKTLAGILVLVKVLKLISALLDAAFLDKSSCVRLVFLTLVTIIIPIIIIIISPIYILFFAVIFFINKIPLLKGLTTSKIGAIEDSLKKRLDFFKKEIKRLQRPATLKRQIAKLTQTEKQIQSGQISYRGRAAN